MFPEFPWEKPLACFQRGHARAPRLRLTCWLVGLLARSVVPGSSWIPGWAGLDGLTPMLN
eukprot:9489258-Pyramimonas_sp.AAC.3